MTDEKEKLEKELRLLKGSLESDIITEEEYKKRKEIIEKKLNELETGVKKAEPKAEEEKEKKEEIEIREIKEEKLKEMEEREEIEKEEEKEAEEVKEEEITELHKREKPTKKKKTKLIIFSVLILIILLIVYIYAFKETNKEKEIIELKPECISDDDCETPNKIGMCLNPNTTEAKCEFKDDVEVHLAILNDNNCISCDTARMFNVIKKLFPSVKTTKIDYNSEEGKELVSKLDISALPSYIFESDIEEAFNFDKFKRALVEKDDKFIINPAASGSNYYFKRNEVKNRLDLFVLPSTAQNVEDNLQGVLDLFKWDIDYSKHIVLDEEEEKRLNKELGITTYPTFLVNNKLKFSGIQSPEVIKNKFCELNELPGCETKLSENIK